MSALFQFGFGFELPDGREVYVECETGNTPEELRTGRMSFGFGWAPVRVIVDDGSGVVLGLDVIEPLLRQLEDRALEAACERAYAEAA